MSAANSLNKKRDLNNNQTVHTVKNIDCDICGKYFEQKDGLKKHR